MTLHIQARRLAGSPQRSRDLSLESSCLDGFLCRTIAKSLNTFDFGGNRAGGRHGHMAHTAEVQTQRSQLSMRCVECAMHYNALYRLKEVEEMRQLGHSAQTLKSKKRKTDESLCALSTERAVKLSDRCCTQDTWKLYAKRSTRVAILLCITLIDAVHISNMLPPAAAVCTPTMNCTPFLVHT